VGLKGGRGFEGSRRVIKREKRAKMLWGGDKGVFGNGGEDIRKGGGWWRRVWSPVGKSRKNRDLGERNTR